jgi:hypothetical protein
MTNSVDESATLGGEPLRRLTRDLRAAAKTLTHAEARYLVDAYYQMQRDRIRAAHQVRQLSENSEPHEVLLWLGAQTGVLELSIKNALGLYAKAHPVGAWAQSIVGIGPVISAGLLAHIEITKAPTVGHIWRFAGLDPTVVWNKKTKRPWNGALKRLCWLIGESFVKVQAHEHDVYGKLYAHRKAIEEQKNADGVFAPQAQRSLEVKDWRRETATKAHYEQGRLPPARIHLRAQRWAVKLFLAHYHHVAYMTQYGTEPPKPYVLSVLQHGHEIRVPNWP